MTCNIANYSSESEDYVEINENSEVKKQKETNLVF